VTNLDYSKENMDVLAEQLRLGCEKTRTRMIEGYMPLVHSKVNKWLKLYPGLAYVADDMISEGYFAIVRAIESIQVGERPDSSNVTAYVSAAIVHGIGEFLDNNHTIRVPRSSNKDIPTMEPIFETGSFHAYHDEIELQDLLETACRTNEDKAIVNLLSRGYTEREVGNRLDIAQSTVNILRREIYDRFTQLERG
jgi:RNA polymerase sigma factor (sigma-70 family)